MTEHDFFSADYAAARNKFLRSCDAAGLRPVSHRLTHSAGPNASELYTDLVWIGPPDASSVLITCSGTHGVEGFYGSACQVGWLRQARHRNLPAGVAVLHVHAINPYGFAWLRRVTEENVDLNRNFVDYGHLPVNGAYGDLHGMLVPESWTESTPAEIQSRIDAYIAAKGLSAYRQALVSGQHTHPDGLFYGGRRAAWSNTLIGHIARDFLRRASRIAIVDFHTGLGPHGHAEIICRHSLGSDALTRARRWYGPDVTSPQAGDSKSPQVDGSLRMAFVDLCPRAEVTSVAIEIGTVPSRQVHMALCADNWLHLRGDLDSGLAVRIKREMREAFCPESEDWAVPVYRRSMEILDQAAAGLVQ